MLKLRYFGYTALNKILKLLELFLPIYFYFLTWPLENLKFHTLVNITFLLDFTVSIGLLHAPLFNSDRKKKCTV